MRSRIELHGQGSAQNCISRDGESNSATDILQSWIGWLREHDAGSGKVGTVGWCFGGGWSLRASTSTAVDATVIYYGNVSLQADQLNNLQGPVLGHFATEDSWINHDMVGGFETAMSDAGKADSLSVNWYEADHAFANPTNTRYDAEDAALAWERTTDFFEQYLG